MSETQANAQQAATEPQQVQPAEPQKPQVLASSLPDETLKARLDQAKSTGRNDLLKELGVSDPSQLKAALDAIKAQEEAAKTTADKLAELAKREQEANQRLQSYQSAIESVWQTESVKLTADQAAAIEAVAGNDIAARVKALNALRSTWQIQTQPQVTAPANTAPAANAPPPALVSAPDIKAQYAQLKQTNPIIAAAFLEQHKREIFTP